MDLDDLDDELGPLSQERLQDALDLLTQVASALTTAAEGKYADDGLFRKRSKRLGRILKLAGIRMPFLWDSLGQWETYAKATFPSNYPGRRAHITKLEAQVRGPLERRLADTTVGDPQSTLTAVSSLASDSLADPSAIKAELRRLEALLPSDPSAAIGTAKNLIEATAKAVLAALDLPVPRNAPVRALVESAMRALDENSDQVAANTSHEPVVAEIVELLQTLAIKVNQLRNKAGNGHGPLTAITGLDLRHGRLAARAAIAWCSYVLETLHDVDVGN